MSQIANITLADGQATPVNHTFTVINPQNGTATAEWRDLSRSARSQQVTVQSILRRANGNSARNKVEVSIYAPILRTDAGGVLQATDMASAKVTITLPDIMLDTERKDLRAYVANFLNTAAFKEQVESLLQQW